MMRLRTLKLFLLAMAFAIAAVSPPAYAQAPGNSELKALNGRVVSLYKAGKFGEAIPLAEQYAAGTKARYGENSLQYALAINNLAQILQDTNRLAEAEPLMRRALADDEGSESREVYKTLLIEPSEGWRAAPGEGFKRPLLRQIHARGFGAAIWPNASFNTVINPLCAAR